MQAHLCIVEGEGHERFGPLTQFRPVFELRCGILTLREKVQAHYGRSPTTLHVRSYLRDTVRAARTDSRVNEWPTDGLSLVLDGRLVADPELPRQIPLDGEDEIVFTSDGEPIAARVAAPRLDRVLASPPSLMLAELAELLPAEPVSVRVARWPWDLVAGNTRALTRDFWKLVAREDGDLHAGHIHPAAHLLHPECIRIGAGSEVQAGAVLDARGGPIYIGRDVRIMAGAVVQGPAAVLDGSVLKIHAEIYASTTIGPSCKVGGEVEASILHGYSNKQHDGFLGHSYIGEWCNLGAGTNNSDLKNSYGNVRVHIGGEVVDTGHLFVGLTMGDHTKTAIGTCFNTGTVVGSCCNIFGAGFPPTAIPAFSWGGPAGFATYDVERAVAVARTVTARRGVDFAEAEEAVLRTVFERTADERRRAGVQAPAPAQLPPGDLAASPVG